uniref:RRM domain-containing protein n=1 Tax=Panagrolaimus sp. PS1159 TaxID=55785 RepID=A0AC35ERQ7_9BILA
MRLTVVNFFRQVGQQARANRENSVMVKNLSWLSSTTEVKEYFLKYGEVKNVYLPFDENQGIYKGYGFVEFRNRNSVHDALDDPHRPKLDGNILTVLKANPEKDKK